jgi:hypothetical protein
MAMQEFRISEAGFKKLKRRMLLLSIIPLVIVVTIFSLTNMLGGRHDTDNTWLYVLPLFPIMLGISSYRSIKKQKKFLETYKVTISDNEITREQLNTPPLTISFMEIKEIIKSEKGHFTIKGAGSRDIIYVANWIEKPEELQQQLQALAPIQARTKDPWHVKYKWAIVIPMMASMLGLFFSNNKIIAGISGAVLVGFIAWLIYEIFTNKNFPTTAKRRVWIFFVMLAAIIYATYTKLTGIPLLQ